MVTRIVLTKPMCCQNEWKETYEYIFKKGECQKVQFNCPQYLTSEIEMTVISVRGRHR